MEAAKKKWSSVSFSGSNGGRERVGIVTLGGIQLNEDGLEYV